MSLQKQSHTKKGQHQLLAFLVSLSVLFVVSP